MQGDETLLHTDESEYGGVLLTWRNYYNRHLSEAALGYLADAQAHPPPPPPRVLWLPLGASKLVSSTVFPPEHPSPCSLACP